MVHRATAIDKDGDGVVSPAEAEAELRRHQVKPGPKCVTMVALALDFHDSDGDGVVSVTELAAGWEFFEAAEAAVWAEPQVALDPVVLADDSLQGLTAEHRRVLEGLLRGGEQAPGRPSPPDRHSDGDETAPPRDSRRGENEF